jgi:hypothetical protein
LIKNSWGNGLTYNAENTKKLMSGENQIYWYSFKESLSEHLSCHPHRSGGQFHLKAKQYQAIQKKKKIAQVNSNMTVVSAGIEVCKMKAAGSTFENMIGLLSFCGANVGNIGHGR